MNNLYNPFPPELDNPSTAWPFLRRRFPWLFDDEKAIKSLDTGQTSSRLEQDVLAFAVYMLSDEYFTLADISEALTGKREYGGAIYTRVKAVRDYLNSTTTDQEAVEVEEPLLLAA